MNKKGRKKKNYRKKIHIEDMAATAATGATPGEFKPDRDGEN